MTTQMRLCHRIDNAVAWVHILEMTTADIDLTDMDDAEFEAYVRAHPEVQ